MKNVLFLAALALALSVGAKSQAEDTAPTAPTGTPINNDIQQDKQELKGDQAKINEDRKELKNDIEKRHEAKKSAREDAQALKQAIKEHGAQSPEAQAAREKLHQDRMAKRDANKEIAEDRKELHKDRMERHKDRMDLKKDRMERRRGRK